MFNHLFSAGRIGSMKTKNRIVMTAMGNHLANADGSVSERDIAFYRARAQGGVGLIITECALIDGARGKGNNHQISVAEDRFIPGLQQLAQEIHRYDGKVVVQIYHPGRQGISAVNGNLPMLAPSEVECQAVHQPTIAMTTAEVAAMAEQFVKAAVRVKAAGIDGVEVHGAHGYLINQFLSPYTNKRDDKYGGSFENRLRFLEEIVLGIRQHCGRDYPLLVRLSVDEFLGNANGCELGLQLADGVKIARRLEKLGVDAIDVSSGIYETMNMAWEPSSFKQGWKSYLAEAIKKAVNIPVIGVAVIRDPEYADKMIVEGKLDFAGSARQHYADPEWSNKAKAGKVGELRKCISCLHCMETLMAADLTSIPCQCGINIQSGRELEYSDFKQDGNGRIVAIIGAGPAGLEAARVLAIRKYKPIIFEKTGKAGGQLELANKPPKKDKINWLIGYLTGQVQQLGVEIRFNTAPTLSDLQALKPYAIFIAQGSEPFRPETVPGITGQEVVGAAEILSGKITVTGKKVAIIGSGMTGLETAHLLAENENEVSIFEMAATIGPGLYFQNLIDVMSHLGNLNVKLHPKHKLLQIDNGRALFEIMTNGEKKEYKFDAIVISLGTKPNAALVKEIKENFEQVYILGDALKAGRIRDAMETGFVSAYNL
ncbi:FAD-dependent oxidoreductase|uniref:2,4-dienoyl-CoA reductase n=1 Tax=Dendrosporobacter quercicolus TaxID=146817 RepID=A0A1G9SN35_9FIRM|nr:FAD-dependent oxidoreductase [Dendrosporobacter quercicolus]NSL48665.1 FAD-dependent oxidoreductase [Dendrosporobacter quercicolus DSM 1736]SDM36886.1 2,4-dienoyl-CoA reductase [Dendrosporobacter quercicolus]